MFDDQGHFHGSGALLDISSMLMMDDTEVTLKRNPKTDGLRRATQKANVRCRER